MADRRESRRERDAFMARLEGRSLSERQRLEAKKKRAAGKKKMTMRQEAALLREEKKAKDERPPAKRKGTSKSRSRIAKRPYNASRQFADTEEGADADGVQGTQGSAGIAPPNDGEISATGPTREIETDSASSRQAARSLCMDSTADDDREDSGVMQAGSITHSPEGAAPNSDVEGDIESDDWYTETKVTTTSGICGGGEDAVTQHAGEEEDVDCDPSEDNEGGTDGDVLLLREKNRGKRQQQQERLAAAKSKVSRDWATTTKNWDALTSVEMEALALDEEALKKLLVDGWDFDSLTHPTRTEAYPGL
ncbi:hypothetical protein PC129_g16525 [Phytophthora cactorum]|uniref:Uncharacterized protein n=1 Tax=Phytophthora cactorum TaxID=29920 RepID=A0A8T1HKT1_9STRA|nr:hypothetical protein PC129_g16525 [Phytophthora cactorum]